MSRSLKKGPYIDENLLKKISKLRAAGNTREVIKTWARASSISPEMVGLTIGIHNGRTHIPILIMEDMVGHKLGEFALTKKFSRHGGKMQKEIEAAAKQREIDAAKAAKEAPKEK